MYELNRFAGGLLGCVFDTIDRIQHMFWRMRDTAHPLHDPELAVRYGDVIGRYYCWMDRILGTVRERHPNVQIIICSDHGFKSYNHSVHLNTWLEQNGYLVRKPDVPSTDCMAELYDWNCTEAYSVGFNSIYLNLKGRERHGCILPEASQRIANELKNALATLGNGKVSAVRTVHSSLCQTGPDLVIGYNAGFRASWQTAVGSISDDLVIEDNLKKWSGDHCCDADLVPGVFFASEKTSIPPNVLEIASKFYV
nr:alkaline phosphatase family protein [Geoanaerobacter pelophilus]